MFLRLHILINLIQLRTHVYNLASVDAAQYEDDDVPKFYEKFEEADEKLGGDEDTTTTLKALQFDRKLITLHVLRPDELEKLRFALKGVFSNKELDIILWPLTTTEATPKDKTEPTIRHVINYKMAKTVCNAGLVKQTAEANDDTITLKEKDTEYVDASTQEYNYNDDIDDIMRDFQAEEQSTTVNVNQLDVYESTVIARRQMYSNISNSILNAIHKNYKTREYENGWSSAPWPMINKLLIMFENLADQIYLRKTPAAFTPTKPHLHIEGFLDFITPICYTIYTTFSVNQTEKWGFLTTASSYVTPARNDLSKNILRQTTTATTATPTPPPTTRPPAAFEDGKLIAKCYVCGMTEPGIPYESLCNDAFAEDMLPLGPVHTTARAQLGPWRKYCEYRDMKGYIQSETKPRVLFGPWTGGCAVRWVDITPVYTQRVCRNKWKPVLGQNYVSKRLAKMENALRDVDNGCLISPVASLVPLSRGVSLFARFHVCVCNTPYCNKAINSPQWTAYMLLLNVVASLSYLGY